MNVSRNNACDLPVIEGKTLMPYQSPRLVKLGPIESVILQGPNGLHDLASSTNGS